MHAAAWSQALPPATLTFKGRWSVPGRRWAGWACVISVFSDGLSLLLSHRGVNNLWVGYVSTPMSGACVLLALSAWHARDSGRRLLTAIPVYVVAWVAVLYFVENLERFSLFLFPAHSIVLLMVCLWTLLRNAMIERQGGLTQQDWFWIASGYAAMYGTAAAVEPLMSVLVEQGQVARAFAVLDFKAALQVLSLIAITVGMLCPVPTEPSGPSSSPAP